MQVVRLLGGGRFIHEAFQLWYQLLSHVLESLAVWICQNVWALCDHVPCRNGLVARHRANRHTIRQQLREPIHCQQHVQVPHALHQFDMQPLGFVEMGVPLCHESS